MATTEKNRAIQALQTLPEHATLDDAIERLCFIAKIEEGLRQSDARDLVSHEEVKKSNKTLPTTPRSSFPAPCWDGGGFIASSMRTRTVIVRARA
jgi:predicted transcriptional regulator